MARKRRHRRLEPPRGIERSFQKRVRAILRKVADKVRDIIVPALPTLVEEAQILRPTSDSKNVRLDNNIAQKIEDLMNSVRLELASSVTDREIERMSQDFVTQVNGSNRAQVTQAIKSVLGVDPFISEPWLTQELQMAAKDTAKLIRSNNQQFLDQVENTLTNGVRRGIRHEEIAKQLMGTSKDELGKVSRFRKAKTRANLIARDQTNKLNGKLTELRQKQAGFKKYIWRTNMDGRERERHADWNGETFTWAEGSPDGTHPGEEINCRCYAEAVVDDD